MAGKTIVLAAIAGAHGVRGEVRVKLFTQSADNLARHARFDTERGPLELLAIRADRPGMAVARLAGIADRIAAQALRGLTLAVPRDRLPPLAPGEYYVADYIGMAVADASGAHVGIVRDIANFGASDILDIALASGGQVMVPFVADVVRDDGDRLVVDPAWLV